MQICEAEFHRREVPRLQRWRTGREEGPQGQHVLRLLQLSEVQIHFGQQADRREVPGLRKRVPGREEPEVRPRHRLPQQRMRLRTARAGPGRGRRGSPLNVASAATVAGPVLALQDPPRAPAPAIQPFAAFLLLISSKISFCQSQILLEAVPCPSPPTPTQNSFSSSTTPAANRSFAKLASGGPEPSGLKALTTSSR